jgi:hypothetical protein
MLNLIIFALCYASIPVMLLGLVALYQSFGLGMLFVAVLMLFMLCMWLESRGGCAGPDWFASDSGPMLPPSSTQRISQSRPVITSARHRSLPGRK